MPNVSVAKDAPKTVYFNPWVEPMNIITYEASAKLKETITPYSSGLHTNVFSGKNGQLTMTSHTFENGVGTIEFDGDVTSIGKWAFYQCSGMTSITIPNGVTNIDEQAFNGCSVLTSITIPDSVTNIGKFAFTRCSGLTSIVVGSANTVYDSRDNCNAIIEIATNTLIQGCKTTVIPNTVTSIGTSAFNFCMGLTSITIPDSVTSIGNDAFSNCSGITSITSLATTAPTIGDNTFWNVKTGGTLTVPVGSTGYDVWMGTGNYYLGKYGWTKVEQ